MRLDLPDSLHEKALDEGLRRQRRFQELMNWLNHFLHVVLKQFIGGSRGYAATNASALT